MFNRFIPKFKIPRAITNMPEVKIACKWAEFGVIQASKAVSWGLPAGVFAGWMIYPALTPNFKNSIGLEDNIKPASINFEEEIGSAPTIA